MPVVRRELERQQLLLRHGAARVEPEAVEELGLPLSKLRVIPLPLGRPRDRRGCRFLPRQIGRESDNTTQRIDTAQSIPTVVAPLPLTLVGQDEVEDLTGHYAFLRTM